MIYSVWNQGTKRFDYYDAPGRDDSATHAGSPKHVAARTMGATPQEAAWPLPAGARKVGAGENAVGRVASLGGDGFGFVALPGYAVVALVAITFWYLGRRNR